MRGREGLNLHQMPSHKPSKAAWVQEEDSTIYVPIVQGMELRPSTGGKLPTITRQISGRTVGSNTGLLTSVL